MITPVFAPLVPAEVDAAIEAMLDHDPTITGAAAWRKLHGLPGVPRYSAFMRRFARLREAADEAVPRQPCESARARRRQVVAEVLHDELAHLERRILGLLDTP